MKFLSLPSVASVIGLVVVIHALAVTFELYFFLWWLDVAMHGLGGLAAGFVGLFFYERWGVQAVGLKKTGQARLLQMAIVLGFVALVGVAWEWYEYLQDVLTRLWQHASLPAQTSLADTMYDFYFDLLGGSVPVIVWWFLHGKVSRTKG